jgi:hypothetical protein
LVQFLFVALRSCGFLPPINTNFFFGTSDSNKKGGSSVGSATRLAILHCA